MKKAGFCFSIIILLVLSNLVLGAIPASERAALIALYNSTNGDSWYSNSGWKDAPLHTDGFAMPGTEGDWYGVTLSGDNVIVIGLRWNHLSGSIPSELGNLSKLEELRLNDTQLSGSIPPELGNLSNLEELSLYNNNLTGSIPPELGNLSNLKSLALYDNQLSGSTPPELGNLSNLKILWLYNNQLSGSIPPELGNLSNLKELWLERNQLSGSIPRELGKLSNLQYLYLGGNQLSGSIPSELSNLSNLQYLYLEYNQLSGSIPSELGNLSNLKELGLSGNQLNGSIPLELGNLSNLQYLYLGGNLSGSIPAELGNLSNLKELTLYSNQLSGSIPRELGNLRNLKKLSLGGNLSGSIPPEFGNLSNLKSLSLGGNLSGSIPPELGNLNQLTYLYLDHNQLSGSIPPEFGNLSNLYQLYLDHNQLSGSIPPEFGNLSYLNVLYLGHNQLSGSIPPEFGKQCRLYQLYLDHNQLSGIIPSSFKNLPQNDFEFYTYLDIGYNCLSAADPALIDWLNKNDPDWETTQCLEEKVPPFGEFSTPIHNSTVYSSIPITGWVLDDYEIDSVKIYCEQGNTLVFIGDALFVKGARPDVEAAYPGYPDNDKAGWGYMLLTNFLPNNGNGTYVLRAIASDRADKTTLLGTKTIIVDNVHAVKPFGAIDTPGQGGTVWGSKFINWGWALTPSPNKIPIDGSTIDIYIDGVNTGHPTYNIYRSDIASLFPNYANSNGAVGYSYLDNTKYTDGVHTINWTAADNAGNTDGIGSRYFMINNYGDAELADAGPFPGIGRHTGQIPGRSRHEENTVEVLPVKGDFPRHTLEELALIPEEKGLDDLTIEELERVEIKLGENYSGILGYLLCNNELKKLPVGSTLDAKTGTFYWSPGPGFLGKYSLVFVLTDPEGRSFKKTVEIKIVPKSKTGER